MPTSQGLFRQWPGAFNEPLRPEGKQPRNGAKVGANRPDLHHITPLDLDLAYSDLWPGFLLVSLADLPCLARRASNRVIPDSLLNQTSPDAQASVLDEAHSDARAAAQAQASPEARAWARAQASSDGQAWV